MCFSERHSVKSQNSMGLRDDHAWGEAFAVSNEWKNCMSFGLSSINVLSCNEALAKNWEKYSLRFHCLIGPAIFCVGGIFFFMEEGLTLRSHQHVGPIHDIQRSTRECQDLVQ